MVRCGMTYTLVLCPPGGLAKTIPLPDAQDDAASMAAKIIAAAPQGTMWQIMRKSYIDDDIYTMSWCRRSAKANKKIGELT
jgi:hypothetical protein